MRRTHLPRGAGGRNPRLAWTQTHQTQHSLSPRGFPGYHRRPCVSGGQILSKEETSCFRENTSLPPAAHLPPVTERLVPAPPTAVLPHQPAGTLPRAPTRTSRRTQEATGGRTQEAVACCPVQETLLSPQPPPPGSRRQWPAVQVSGLITIRVLTEESAC